MPIAVCQGKINRGGGVQDGLTSGEKVLVDHMEAAFWELQCLIADLEKIVPELAIMLGDMHQVFEIGDLMCACACVVDESHDGYGDGPGFVWAGIGCSCSSRFVDIE